VFVTKISLLYYKKHIETLSGQENSFTIVWRMMEKKSLYFLKKSTHFKAYIEAALIQKVCQHFFPNFLV